jgi:hypothetical protein
MVSGASFNLQKDNSSRIRKKIHPGYWVQGVKKAPDPGSATLPCTHFSTLFKNSETSLKTLLSTNQRIVSCSKLRFQ